MSCVDEPVPDYVADLTGDLSGTRIGVDRLTRVAGELADPALPGVLDAALTTFESLGAEIVEVELPYYGEMSTACLVIMMSEALAYHLPDMRQRWSDYFVTTRATVGTGIFYSAADYVQAQRARRVVQLRIADLFESVDLVLTPTSSAGAPTFVEMQALVRDSERGEFTTLHTPYWDAAGNPVLSVPVGRTASGLPLAVQLAGRPFEEAVVLRAGDAYQSVTDWHRLMPPIVDEAA